MLLFLSGQRLKAEIPLDDASESEGVVDEQRLRREAFDVAVGESPETLLAALPNSGFEIPDEKRRLPGWKMTGNGPIKWALDGEMPCSGASSLRLDVTKEGKTYIAETEGIPVSARAFYRLSVWVRKDALEADVVIAAKHKTDKGVTFSSAICAPADERWTLCSITGETIEAPLLLRPFVMVRNVVKPGAVWIDDVELLVENRDETLKPLP